MCNLRMLILETKRGPPWMCKNTRAEHQDTHRSNKKVITSKNMTEMPLISMQILGYQFLSWRLLRHILLNIEGSIFQILQTPHTISTDSIEQYSRQDKILPMRAGIHLHDVSIQRTHHECSYQRLWVSYKRNGHGAVEGEEGQFPSPQQSHLASIADTQQNSLITIESICPRHNILLVKIKNIH